MRLGTRSCAECRRRHVRCIFSQGSPVCEGCALHSVSCVSQEANRRKKRQTERGVEGTLQRRVKELEDAFRQIRDSVDHDPNSPMSANVRAKMAEALSSFVQPSPTAGSSAEESRIASDANYTPSTSEDASIPLSNFEEAPMIALFQDALMIQSAERGQDAPCTNLSRDVRMHAITQHLKSLLPQPAKLRLILAETEKYWATWPPCFLGPDVSDLLREGRLDYSVAMFSKALASTEPGMVAKVVVFLALCVQQVPIVVQRQQLDIQSSTEVIKSYMKATKSILSISEDVGESIDDIECLALQAKLYLNLGVPRKVWTSIRRALNASLLLGLHRLRESDDQRKRRLWDQIWQVDRHAGMVLGFPCAISNSHPSVAQDIGAQGIRRLSRQMSFVSGAVIERNQNLGAVDYSVTVKLQEEIEKLRATMPEEWWFPVPSPLEPLADVFFQASTKLQYFLLCKVVHLPYMLKSTTSKKFEHSREVVLETSRDLIRTYQGFRHSSQAQLAMCEAMEFGAFCAAAILAIDIFARSPRRPLGEELEDFRLVDALVITLRRFASIMECNIASQAAQLLDFMSAIYRGSYTGPENFEAVIPYFGRVRINWPSVVRSRMESDDQSSNTNSSASKSLEFSTSTLGFLLPMDPSLDAEIGLDWTTTMDMTMDPMELDDIFDWDQTFDLRRHFLMQ